jgi:hypothetical protein
VLRKQQHFFKKFVRIKYEKARKQILNDREKGKGRKKESKAGSRRGKSGKKVING